MKLLSTKRFQLKEAGLFAIGILIANGTFVPLHAAVKIRPVNSTTLNIEKTAFSESQKLAESVIAL